MAEAGAESYRVDFLTGEDVFYLRDGQTHAEVMPSGKINVAEEALIAPGAYVNFNVPAHGLVLGNPGKVVSMTGSEGYVNQTWPPETQGVASAPTG